MTNHQIGKAAKAATTPSVSKREARVAKRILHGLVIARHGLNARGVSTCP